MSIKTEVSTGPVKFVRKAKLLLVDDNPGNLIALQAVLAGPQYELYTAASGEEALELIEQYDFALVLLDVQMPGMDGFETARQIKLNPKGDGVPIIFITAVYKEDPFVKKGYEVGAVDYFSKPFDPEILKLKVALYSAFKQNEYLLKEREARIAHTEDLLRAGQKLSVVLEKLPVGVLIADEEGRICQINEEVARIWEFQKSQGEDAYGKFFDWWERDGKVLKGTRGPLTRALVRGEASHNEILPIKTLTGNSKMVLSSASPLRDAESRIVGVVVVTQDVTEHKEIEQDMESRIQKLISMGPEFERAANE